LQYILWKDKKKNNITTKKPTLPINYFYIEEDNELVNIRVSSQALAIKILNEKKSLHLESEIGSGRFGFLHSLTYKLENKHFLRVDMSDVISKSQLEDRVKKDTGTDIVGIMEKTLSYKDVFFLIFDNITNQTNQETLNFLKSLPNTLLGFQSNLFFIFTSASRINQFSDISIKLSPLTNYETKSLISCKLPHKSISDNDIQRLHEKSEGLVTKIDVIIKYLAGASIQEVIDSNDIFDDIMTSDNISNTVLKNINKFKEDPNNIETYNLMKILSILKNGESITNIKKSRLGKGITIKNSIQIVDAGLAKSIDIDQTTTILKLNPLVKDLIYKYLTEEEKKDISNEYLDVMIKNKKDSLYISTTNRKIIEMGYSTDGDNIVELLFNKVTEINKLADSNEKKSLLNMTTYSSRAYIYSLNNFSRYKEIIASSPLLNSIIDNTIFQLENYYYLAKSYRMLGDYDSSKTNLDLAISKCNGENLNLLSAIRSEEILLTHRLNKEKALALSRKTKKEFKQNTLAYITSEEIIALELKDDHKIKTLTKLESKARRLGFNTSANNILFELNKNKTHKDKIKSMDVVLSTDSSEYNKCRAFIYKMESLITNGDINKITEKNIESLSSIYNYLFHQKIDGLFNQCLDVLWDLLEYRKKTDLIIYIYAKGVLIWRLDNDIKSEQKYKNKLSSINKEKFNNAFLINWMFVTYPQEKHAQHKRMFFYIIPFVI